MSLWWLILIVPGALAWILAVACGIEYLRHKLYLERIDAQKSGVGNTSYKGDK